MADADDEFRKLAASIAKDQARKAISRKVFGDEAEDEVDDDEEGPGIVRKGLGVVVGGVALAWFINQVIPIIPFVGIIPYLFAFAAIGWSLNQWGLKPIRSLRRWRARRQLKKADKALDKDIKKELAAKG